MKSTRPGRNGPDEGPGRAERMEQRALGGPAHRSRARRGASNYAASRRAPSFQVDGSRQRERFERQRTAILLPQDPGVLSIQLVQLGNAFPGGDRLVR